MNTRLSEQDIHNLLQSDEDQLIEQLGMRRAAVEKRPELSADVAPRIVAADVRAMGVVDDFKTLGRRILRTWERSAYEILCGSNAEDAKARENVRNALGLGEAATIAAISTALIGLGLMPALAPLVAAILVKKFFNPAYQDFCLFWGEKLPR